MSTATIAGTSVELNNEGFFVDPTQWTREIAVEMATADGISPITDQHWQVIDFNYETEPLPGHFPGRVGMPLLKESRMNHLGKLMFQWFYWHALLQGRDVPGIGADMPEHGKEHSQQEEVLV